jgi:hypothetical protein
MVLVSEPPENLMNQKTKKGKNPVEVFNGSSSKLSKLPVLVEYVSVALNRSDFIVVLGNGEPIEMSPAQFEVIRSVYRTPREALKSSVRRLCLYFLMRYDDFTIRETALTDLLSGLRVRLALEQDVV